MEENHMGWKLVRGVRQDVIKLFKLFTNTNSVRYEEFCKVWKEMKFYTIFSSRFIYIERLEFIEELFQIVKEYLLPLYEFPTRVAALYTLYGLYFKQPLREPVKIRFTKSEWSEFQSFINTCKEEKHFDIVFIYLKMYLKNAFIFTASLRPAGLELGYRKYFKQRNAFYNICDGELLYRPLLSDNLVTSLVKLESLYCKKKFELLGKKNLEFIDTNFSLSLQDELKKYAVKYKKNTSLQSNYKEIVETIDGQGLNSSIIKSDKQQEIGNKEISASGSCKRKNLSRIYLLAKKKAEFYMKQLQSKEEEETQSQATQLELPELDA